MACWRQCCDTDLCCRIVSPRSNSKEVQRLLAFDGNAPLVLESVSLTDVYREIQHACPNTRTYSMYSLALSLSLYIYI